MKYAIISDIHGNLGAFKRAVADAKKRKCQKIICLGDLTGYRLRQAVEGVRRVRDAECRYVPYGQP